MNNFTVNLPDYTIGNNVLEEIGSICQNYGKKILIIGGETALAKTEEKLKSSLKEFNLIIKDILWYGGECSFENIELLLNKIKDEDIDLIVGVGGGKALDTAKGAAEKINLPIITVPTIAATCAAVTPLSVVYTDAGDFDCFFHLTKPPVHSVIDLQVISRAPAKYLWAGIGDTIAKYYEVEIKTRKDNLDYKSSLGKEMSIMCVKPLLKYGKKALTDNKNNNISEDLEQVVLNIIVSTGLVSMHVREKYNGACAHSLCYGLATIEEIEKMHLHGELVAYGVLVQLTLDQQQTEFEKVYSFFKKIKMPLSLQDFEIEIDNNKLEVILEKTLSCEDMIDMPYSVSKNDLAKAIDKLEKVN